MSSVYAPGFTAWSWTGALMSHIVLLKLFQWSFIYCFCLSRSSLGLFLLLRYVIEHVLGTQWHLNSRFFIYLRIVILNSSRRSYVPRTMPSRVCMRLVNQFHRLTCLLLTTRIICYFTMSQFPAWIDFWRWCSSQSTFHILRVLQKIIHYLILSSNSVCLRLTQFW